MGMDKQLVSFGKSFDSKEKQLYKRQDSETQNHN